MIIKKIKEFLKDREFVSVATCDLSGRPNAAPKFLLKIDGDYIYFIDYAMGRTWENLKINPRVSLSFIDTETLIAYQVNGRAELIAKGPLHEKLLSELLEKEVNLTSKRIINGLYSGKKHEGFELAISENFVIFKVKIDEVVEINPSGNLNREKL